MEADRRGQVLAGRTGGPHQMKLLLVHGLWRTPWSFLLLNRQLHRWGYQPEQFGYAAVAQRYRSIVERLVQRLEALAANGPYAVIGHSLGGVLLRSALPLVSKPAPLHFVMLGTPNRSPRLAQALGARWVYRQLMGECGGNLASPGFYASLPVPQVPYSIVAGTAGPRGRWSPFGMDLNDGIVAVRETLVRDDDPVVALPVTHTFMMNDSGVQEVIRKALTLSGDAA
jgi:hypothetical protein